MIDFMLCNYLLTRESNVMVFVLNIWAQVACLIRRKTQHLIMYR